MEAGGFVQESPEIYTLDMQDEFFGWVSLALYRSGEAFQIVAKVGLGHDGVEQLVSAASDPRARGRGRRPAVSKYLGYLMPQNSASVGWEFNPDVSHDRVAQNIAVSVLLYGRPYMDACADLERLVDLLKNAVPWEDSQDRIPAALVCLGRPNEALAFIDAELSEMRGRSDAAAKNFRRFAARFPAAIAPG